MTETKKRKSETGNQNESLGSSLVTRGSALAHRPERKPKGHSSLVPSSDPDSSKPRRRAGLRPAVFLDRDGTISEEVGYVNHIDRLRLFPWTAPAIRQLNEAGMVVVVVTNQSGVGQGYFPEELVHAVHERIREELARQGARVDAFYYCPHHPNARLAAYRMACRCRKPDTGMLERAAADLGLDLGLASVVGDSTRDIETGFRAGARTALVLTGYGKGNYEYHRAEWLSPPDFVAENLLEAVERILAERPHAEAGRGAGTVLPGKVPLVRSAKPADKTPLRRHGKQAKK
jgi:D-glycero-D-manno-heptose 1,7-bisphosphate phosphatase